MGKESKEEILSTLLLLSGCMAIAVLCKMKLLLSVELQDFVSCSGHLEYLQAL